MSYSLPFPSSASGLDMPKGAHTPSLTHNYDMHHQLNMKIDIPKDKDDANNQHLAPSGNATRKHHTIGSATNAAHPQQHFAVASLPVQSPGSTAPHHPEGNHIPPRGSSAYHSSTGGVGTAPANWVHHPRQPHQNAESYFPSHNSHLASSGSAAPAVSQSANPPRTPGSIRGHSRQTSGAGQNVQSALVPSSRSTKNSTGHNMNLNLSSNTGGINNVQQQQSEYGNYAGPSHAGPPSPSTLTDIILGLHSTLYGAKRTPEEVRERVYAFYDSDAIFESPLLAAKGREEIANQFIMAFSLPGMDVTSELRDVICSDFEFDGTRAGIIDQTISVTFLPRLFGSHAQQASADYAYYQSQAATGQVPPEHHAGTSTPGYTLQSAGITPHPFGNYSQAQTPAGGIGSMFSRFTSSRPHSPTTPFSMSNLWGASRPHTPGAAAHGHSHIRPFSSTTSAHPRPSTPPSVNGDDDEGDTGHSQSTIHASHLDDASHFMSANEAGGGQVARLQMPPDAVRPHWTSDGLGRASVRALLWGILHPRAVLKSLCTIQLRLMSRLEFNDAGLIVRHEDTWGLRETIEGTIPFASVVYALERRVVGYLCSFAVGRGFKLSSTLTRSLEGGDRHHHWAAITSDEKYHPDANDAARALLLGQHHRQEQLHSMARSRASSPSRHRFSGHATPYSHTFSAGTRSRARSLVGQQLQAGPMRAASSDNLWNMSNNLAGYGDRERGSTTGGGDSLPPDSSARYRDRGIRRPTSSTASAPTAVGGNSNTLDGLWQNGDKAAQAMEAGDVKSRAPDRDL